MGGALVLGRHVMMIVQMTPILIVVIKMSRYWIIENND